MIYFISYPKCGRTWCRTIINEYARRARLPQPAPRKDIHKDKSIKITKEDIEGDLHEGRD